MIEPNKKVLIETLRVLIAGWQYQFNQLNEENKKSLHGQNYLICINEMQQTINTLIGELA